MRKISDVHTHSTWCDGHNSPREMAESALALGFAGLGFSSHSPAPFDPRCPGIADEAAYRADIAALKAEYAGRLDILCGIEQDACAPVDEAANYDYIITATHYLPPRGSEYPVVDGDVEELGGHIERYFGGDANAMAREYFEALAGAVRAARPNIVAHFDLIAKYNESTHLFDEESRPYREAALQAMDEVLDVLAGSGGMVEVNTGAMARGYRSRPYPAPFILRHMAARGARVIITGDSHSTAALAALARGYGGILAALRAAGFTRMAVMQGGEFVDVAI